MLKSVRLPLFVVEIAYAGGIQELATSSKISCVDPSELVVFQPSENEFHTRLEVRSSGCYEFVATECGPFQPRKVRELSEGAEMPSGKLVVRLFVPFC